MTRSRPTTRCAVVVVAVLGLASASCSESQDSGPPSSDERPYVDAMAAGLVDNTGVGMSQDDAECIATRTVKAVGVEAFQENGVAPEALAQGTGPTSLPFSISIERAKRVVNGIDDCVGLVTFMAAGIAATAAMNEAGKQCLEERLDEPGVRALVEDGLTEGGQIEGVDAARDALTATRQLCEDLTLPPTTTTLPGSTDSTEPAGPTLPEDTTTVPTIFAPADTAPR